jgi:hypothetical protein
VSRYRWPARQGGRENEDAPGGRAAFIARCRLEFDPDAARRAARSLPNRREGPAVSAPASGRQHLWQPLGPVTVVRGQAEGHPRITGRIAALAVHPLGERVYAASANGGVWYSRDGGAHWESLGGFAPTDVAGIDRPQHRNACGAIEVQFGATEADDVVYVGTGEVTHPFTATPTAWISGQPGRPLAGVGILRAVGPGALPQDNPWTREAKNLVGNGIYRIVTQPGGVTVIAATLTGLYERPAGAGADTDWVRTSGTPFDTLSVECTDVLWTAGAGARPGRLWVWVERGPNGGLWVRDDPAPGVTNNFRRVATPGTTSRRAALAASTPPDRIWVLNDQGGTALPLLFRVSNTGAALPVATAVTSVPNVLRTQGFYDIAVAVDPTRPDRVALAGSVLATTTPDGGAVSGDAAITFADVVPAGAVFRYGAAANPFTMIGIGVHADVHDLKYSNNGNRLWAACDGGVFRSDNPTRPAGFYPRADGIAVVEPNFLGSHPQCEGFVAAGLQDNAVVERVSSGVWKLVGLGDGGGIAFDPLNPSRFIRQHFQAFWSSSDSTLTGTEFMTRAGAFVNAEHQASAFYSMPASIAHRRGAPAPPAPNVGQILVGTTRPWYSENFGGSWVTLPTGTDPLPANLSQDGFGEQVTVCRWQSPDVAWVLGEGRLMRYARTPGSDNGGGPGAWKRETIIKKGVKNKKDTTAADGPVRDSPVWTDVAVNLDPPPSVIEPPAPHGTRGAVYLGTIGKPGRPDVDTLWWFDGTSKWFKTGLRNDPDGAPAPVTAIVCDPAFPDEVYVGTTIGLWKGVRTQVGGANPAWTWHKRLNGLPEAPVEDLAIFSDGGVRLLRAAIAARGVWQLRLDVEEPPDLTYVRAHGDDLRMRVPAVSLQRDGVTARSWHGSPDVRPRIAPAAVAAPATLPWRRGLGAIDAEKLRRFQAALRSRTNDPRVRANGEWDVYFSEVLRDLGAPILPSPPAPAANTPGIDVPFWNLNMQAPHATAEPWGAATPTEADLLELTPSLTEGSSDRASCTLPRKATKVDVVVHHRGLDPRDGAGVRVVLLRWIDPRAAGAASWSDATTWATGDAGGNVPWAAAVNEVLNSPGGTTSHAFANGWSFIGATPAARRKTLAGQTIDSLHSGVVTFDIDFSTVADNRLVLLVAVIRAGADVALAPDTLQNLAMSSSNVAVRSVRAHP